MTYFYRFMAWITWAEFIIANSTGRNPDNVRQLRRDADYWQGQLDLHLLKGV